MNAEAKIRALQILLLSLVDDISGMNINLNEAADWVKDGNTSNEDNAACCLDSVLTAADDASLHLLEITRTCEEIRTALTASEDQSKAAAA